MPEFLEGFFSATWLLSVRFFRRRLFYDAFFWCLGAGTFSLANFLRTSQSRSKMVSTIATTPTPSPAMSP